MKTLMISAGALCLIFATSSCKKIYTCECSVTTTTYEQSYTDPTTGQKTVLTPASTSNSTISGPTLTKMKKKDAESWCESNNYTDDEPGWYKETATCSLKS